MLLAAGTLVFVFAGMASAFANNSGYGTNGDNKMVGSMGQDALCGEGGDGQLVGGSGADFVEGNDGADYTKGGMGGDLIKGGTFNQTNDGSRNVIDCGPGNDTAYITGVDVAR